MLFDPQKFVHIILMVKQQSLYNNKYMSITFLEYYTDFLQHISIYSPHWTFHDHLRPQCHKSRAFTPGTTVCASSSSSSSSSSGNGDFKMRRWIFYVILSGACRCAAAGLVCRAEQREKNEFVMMMTRARATGTSFFWRFFCLPWEIVLYRYAESTMDSRPTCVSGFWISSTLWHLWKSFLWKFENVISAVEKIFTQCEWSRAVFMVYIQREDENDTKKGRRMVVNTIVILIRCCIMNIVYVPSFQRRTS